MVTEALLQTHLAAAVPLHIAELKRDGGPDETHLEQLREFSWTLGAEGDVLLFGGKPGRAGELAARLAEAVAVLSFCPGGVRLCGLLFCAAHAPGGQAQASQYCERCGGQG